MKKTKLKHIEIFIQDTPDFEKAYSSEEEEYDYQLAEKVIRNRKVSEKEEEEQEIKPKDKKKKKKEKRWDLEQVITPADIAADALHKIFLKEESVDDYIIGDFGCGTGRLMTGLLHMGASVGIGIDLDQTDQYLEIANDYLTQKWCQSKNDFYFEFIKMDLFKSDFSYKNSLFDLVITNPPFGTKNNEGIDVTFVEKACKLCRGNVYSFHKTTTREYLEKFAEKIGRDFELIAQYKYPIYKKFKVYHKQDVKLIDVDFICFEKRKMKKRES